MKRLLLFLLRIGNKKIFTFKGAKMGGYIVTVRRFGMTITTASRDFLLKMGIGTRMYFFTRSLAEKGDVEGIHTLAAIVYMAVNAISSDAAVAKEVVASINKWAKRVGSKKPETDGTEDYLAINEVKNMTKHVKKR